MLAVMKLGAVIMPTTTAVGPADLRRPDRARRRPARGLQRRRRRQVRRGPGRLRAASASAPATGERAGGTTCARRTTSARSPSSTRAPRPATGCCSTSPAARPRRPKLVEHTQVSYPVGHLSTMYWLGLRPGDVHLNISSPGLGQARLVVLLRAVDRRGDRPGLQLRALRRGRAARAAPRARRSPPSARRRRCGGCSSTPTSPAAAASLREVDRRRRAAQPRGHRAGPPALGADHPRRLRADRDHRADRQHARAQPVKPGLDGPAAARRPGGPGRPGRRATASRAPARARSASTSGRAAGRCR